MKKTKKVLLSLVMATLVAGSIGALAACGGNNPPPCTSHVDANSDGKCDNCGETVTIPSPPPADTDFVTASDSAYKFTYKLNYTNADAASTKGTYVGANSDNEYNTLTVGAISPMGDVDGYTALELKADNKYLLIKDITGAMIGVHIQYTFEGSYTVSGNDYTLAAPTSGSAYEKLSQGFINNGIKPNYGEKKTSAGDAKILNWFNTAYVSYVAEGASAQVVTLDTTAKTLTYKGATVDPETPPAPEVEAVVTKEFQLPTSQGGTQDITAKFNEDGTYTVSVGASGKWYYKDGTIVATDGVWDAEAKKLTVSFFAGKAQCPITLTTEDLTALSEYTTAWSVTEATAKLGTNDLALDFLHDGTFKVLLGAGKSHVGGGTWSVTEKELTVATTNQGASVAWAADTKTVTYTMPGSNGATPVSFVLSAANAKALGIVVEVASAQTTFTHPQAGEVTATIVFNSDNSYDVTLLMGGNSTLIEVGTWKVEGSTLSITKNAEGAEPVALTAERTLTVSANGTPITFTLDNTALYAISQAA